MRRHAQSGVTLVEMLVALAIVAVLAGSAVALLPVGRSQAPLDHALRDLSQDLMQVAQTNALTATGFTVEWTDTSYRILAGGTIVSRDLPNGVDLQIKGTSPFVVSSLGVPEDLRPITMTLKARRADRELHFDGLNLGPTVGGADAQR